MIPHRKGLDRGRGSGYRNVIANYDSKIHSQSARGVKQPQRANLIGGKDKFQPNILTSIDTAINDYMQLSDKSKLTPVEKARLEQIEKKLTKVHVGKQLKNYMKTHKVMLISAATGALMLGVSYFDRRLSDPSLSASLLAYPLGFAAYETKLINKLEDKEFQKLDRKFPNLDKAQKEQLAIRLVRKDIYGGKAGDKYVLFEHNGEVFRYELSR